MTVLLDFKQLERTRRYFCFELKDRQRLESLASCLLSAMTQPSASSCCLELVKSVEDPVVSWILWFLFEDPFQTRGLYPAPEICIQAGARAES